MLNVTMTKMQKHLVDQKTVLKTELGFPHKKTDLEERSELSISLPTSDVAVSTTLSLFNTGDPERFYENLKEIGYGSFGSVYFALTRDTKEMVAIKKMSFMGRESVEKWKSILREFYFLRNVSHPNTIECKGCYLKEHTTWLVMEYCLGSASDILSLLQRPLTEEEIGALCTGLLRALSYLHALGRIHRDIKAGNILLTQSGTVKLSDFGSASLHSPARAFVGSPFWLAPEVIQAADEEEKELYYDEKVDIWSLGITCIELGEAKPPHSNMNPICALYQIVADAENPPTLATKSSGNWSFEFSSFVNECLTRNPDERPTSKEISSHPFILKQREKSSDVLFDLVNHTKSVANDVGLNTTNFPTIHPLIPTKEKVEEHDDKLHLLDYMRMRREHHQAVFKLQEKLRSEMSRKQKQLHSEVSDLVKKFQKKLEKMRIEQEVELELKRKENARKEKKLLKKISERDENERIKFYSRMKSSSKTENRRNFYEEKEEELGVLLRVQKTQQEVELAALRKEKLGEYQELEEELLGKELSKRKMQLEQIHSLLLKQWEVVANLELKNLSVIHVLRETHRKKRYEAEIKNQIVYMKHAEKKHELESSTKIPKAKCLLGDAEFELERKAKENAYLEAKKGRDEELKKLINFQQDNFSKAEKRREEEKRKLEERLGARKRVLEKGIKKELDQFQNGKVERLRLLHERQGRGRNPE